MAGHVGFKMFFSVTKALKCPSLSVVGHPIGAGGGEHIVEHPMSEPRTQLDVKRCHRRRESHFHYSMCRLLGGSRLNGRALPPAGFVSVVLKAEILREGA
jgi:hypothetical protein